MIINTDKIHWVHLRKQKAILLDQIKLAESNNQPEVVDGLYGILHLVDYIQDTASEEIGEEEVFGADDE
jgi:hypothetical protein